MPIARAHTLQHASGALRSPRAQYITARSAAGSLNYRCTAFRLENVKCRHEAKLKHTLALTSPCQLSPCSISLGLVVLQKNTRVDFSGCIINKERRHRTQLANTEKSDSFPRTLHSLPASSVEYTPHGNRHRADVTVHLTSKQKASSRFTPSVQLQLKSSCMQVLKSCNKRHHRN